MAEILELYGPWLTKKQTTNKIAYDPACYDLAEHFLQDGPCRNDAALYKKHCGDLAQTIQRAIEDWFITPDKD